MKKYKYEKKITIDGKRYSIRADSLTELGAKEAMKRRDIEEGKVTVSSSMTVEQWAKICLEEYKPKASAETLKQSRYRINKHIIPEIGKYKVKQVRPIQCQRILNRQSGMSYSHVKKLRDELRFLFDKAVENKIILESPAEHLQMPDTTKGLRRALTATERKHFLKVCEQFPQFLVFELMLYCGCRPEEACSCIGSDVFEKDGYLFLHIRGTKTKNSDRLVPVPDALHDRLMAVSRLDPIAPGHSNRVLTKTAYRRLTERLRREMNISMGCKTFRNQLLPPFPLADDFVPYNLRHTYCTDLQKKGIDVRTAQRLMGHADIQTTVNIYTHVDMESITAAAEKLSHPLSHPCSEDPKNKEKTLAF